MRKLEDTIVLLLAVICLFASASPNKSHVDQLSLLSIKAHINSDILASNWSKETSFCTWAGITCGKRHSHRVTRLDLSDMDLRGTIAKEIGNLTFLRFVDISNNSINSLIPAEIGLLRRLQALNLSNNYLSGNIPTSLSGCVELKMFDLSHNNLSGTFPVGFGNWSQLQDMSLKSNSLTGKVPPSIGNMSCLEVFDISENSLYGTVVWELGQLSSLKILNLQTNNLSGEVPRAIFNLSMLQLLSLRENNLSGTLPFSIDKGLPNIEQIFLGNIKRRSDLRENQFGGMIPNSISNLSKLVTLDLSDNSFTHVPMSLGNLHQLQMLNLEANHLTNNISNPEQDFLSSLSACKNLKFIDISFNPITGILPKSLGSSNLSVSLETFKAFSCRILDPIPDEIGNLSSLLWLNLGYNHFTDTIPTTLGRLRSLKNLEICGNRFHGSISPVLCNLNLLYSLNLAINGFSGELPSCLGNLSSLREIYLSHNEFNSSIGSVLWFHNGVSNMKTLITLDLSGNQLSGEIPSTISQLQNLNRLSLSRNKLKGHIVKNFADLKDLQYLDLSHNSLNGPIPKSLEALPLLNYFDVSYNELTGEIPERGCFVNFTAEFFFGNKGLCGAPVFKVKKCKSFSLEKLLLCISVLIAVVIGLTVWRILARKRYILSDDPLDLKYVRTIYLDEILRVTGNLDEQNLIGRGSVGSVYKGYFSNDVHAVKVYNLDVPNALESFNRELQIMSSVRHRNLVKMINYCSQIDFKALVMTYMRNGDLGKWLHSSISPLGLSERLRVMIDVACAIQYLHEDHIPPVVHCDINPKNIFLDEDMVAHVGDFGIARLLSPEDPILHSTTLGTVGYIAPEYGSQGLISTTVDVYSFGVLLLEILSRRKPTDDFFTGELTMRRWVVESFPYSVLQIVDNDLLVNEEARVTYKSLLTSLIWVALECTSDLPEERPNMRDVRTRIKDINAVLQVKLGHFENRESLVFADSGLADIDFEDLEVLEGANVENAEKHDRFEVITCKAIVCPMVMSQCLNNNFHQLECQQDNSWEDTYKRFLLSSEQMNVGVGYGVSAQYFNDIENVNVDFEEHHINAYLGILHDDPEFAGMQRYRRRVAIVDTMFSANVQEIWMRYQNSKTMHNTRTIEDLPLGELEFLLQYVRGERPMWRNSTNWFDCDEVIVVYNFSEHWVVCKLNLTSCTILLFDSLQHTFTNKSRKQRVVDTRPLASIVPVLLTRARFWEKRMDLRPRYSEWPVKIPKQANAFVQTDSHSCGAFAMMNVEGILRGSISPAGAQDRIPAYRQHIAHTVFRLSSKHE